MFHRYCGTIRESIFMECYECTKKHLLNGCDPNMRIKEMFVTENLLWFSRAEHDIFKLLIDFGANPYHIGDDGWNQNVIHLCVMKGFFRNLDYLITEGFNIMNLVSSEGKSTLSFIRCLPQECRNSTTRTILNSFSERKDYLFCILESILVVLFLVQKHPLYEKRISKIVMKYMTHNIK